MLAMNELAQMMRCTSCKGGSLTAEVDAIHCSDCGKKRPVRGNAVIFDDANAGMSDEWKALQSAGSVEYVEGRGISVADPMSELFGCFMSVTFRPEHKVLDVGGGAHSELPSYIRQLGPEAYISLEPETFPVLPSYPLLVGAIAEKIPIADNMLDAVMFVTSQDHIEGIDEAMAETRRVLKPHGTAYMWIGIYDPDTIASVKTFDVIWRGSAIKKAVRFMAAQVEYAHTLWKMRDRTKKLAAGARLDPYHCRYYTRERVTADLARWGFIETRRLEVPNSNGLFVEARPA